MMPVVFTLLVGTLIEPSVSLRLAEGRVITSDRGTCIEGPHEPLRVRRLPGTVVFSARPRNPLEDAYVHCRSENEEGSEPEARTRGQR